MSQLRLCGHGEQRLPTSPDQSWILSKGVLDVVAEVSQCGASMEHHSGHAAFGCARNVSYEQDPQGSLPDLFATKMIVCFCHVKE